MDIFRKKKREADTNYQKMVSELNDDYGKDDVYGPWTKSCLNPDGTLKMFKSYWLISTNDVPPNMYIFDENLNKKILRKLRKEKLEKLNKI
jgi:hypothetical protein